MFLATLLLTLAPGAEPVALAPSADGKLLFVAMSFGAAEKADPGFVCVWDLGKAALRDVIPGVPGHVRQIQPTADGKWFALVTGTAYQVRQVVVYDTAAKKPLHTFEEAGKYGSEAVVSPDGAWVAMRSRAEKPELRVWNTDTGKRAEEAEKAAGPRPGSLAFTADGKLAVAAPSALTLIDPGTGKSAGGWTRGEPAADRFRGYGGSVALLPDGKGFVSVAATGKRRQSYVVAVVTEKGEQFLGEAWDHAGAPALSPDGRLLLVSAGGTNPHNPGGMFALKLGADGAPEMSDKADDKGPFWGRRMGEKSPAWAAWPVAEKAGGPARAVPQPGYPGVIAFAPDGKRLFVAGPNGVRVFDTDRREPTATLFATAPAKGEPPAWHILTPAGAFTASAGEAEALEKAGKTRDPAQVEAALGVK